MLAMRSKFKMVYFDRSIIKRNWKRINTNPLHRAGQMVRKVARGSIRPRKRRPKGQRMKEKPSKAPNPPFSRAPGKPFKRIFNVPNKLGTSEIVGMMGFGKAPGSTMPVPGLHEHGGSAVRRVFVKSHQRRTKKGRFGKNVMKPVRKLVRYPKREFMKPALAKVRKNMPHLWRGSLGRITGKT